MPTNRASDKVGARATALTAMQSALNLVPVATANNPVSELAARFGSFANTVQTRLDASGAGAGTLGGTLEAQVERALAQAMRSTADGGAPAGPGAQAYGTGSLATMVAGTPAMSPYQATLVREAGLAAGDLLGTLDSLTPLSPFADPGDVAALQALVRVEVETLVAEFARSTLAPRQQRVRVLLGGLLGWPKPLPQPPVPQPPLDPNAPGNDVSVLVDRFNLQSPLVPTLGIEEQLAGQQVIASDALQLASLWVTYWSLVNTNPAPGTILPSWPLWEPGMATQPAPRSGLGVLSPTASGFGAVSSLIGGLSFADRMIRADLLLPVLAQDAEKVRAALEAIGLSSGEQEVIPLTLWSFVDHDIYPDKPHGKPPLPTPGPKPPPQLTSGWPIPVYSTIADFLDWASTLAGPGGPDLLRKAGALGLNLLADQADELFWLALAMVDPSASAQMDELADTQVQIEIVSLARDLNALANLAY